MRLTSQLLVLAAGVAWSAAASAAAPEPPMGQFNGAYYACDQGQGFEVSYDSKDPKTATLTTSNNNRQYHLKRAAQPGVAQFTDGTVSASFSGSTANVQGTKLRLADCKLKTTT